LGAVVSALSLSSLAVALTAEPGGAPTAVGAVPAASPGRPAEAAPPPTPPAPPPVEDPTWKAVERIDAKLANAQVFMTVFIGVIALLLGLYEFFKVREIENIRQELEGKLEGLFHSQFKVSGREYENRLARLLIEKVDRRAVELADEQIQLAAVGHRAIISYVSNDLGFSGNEPLTADRMRLYLELERALIQLGATSDDDNMIALTLLQSLTHSVSQMTAGMILHYLVLVRRAQVLRSWDNQALCSSIIRKLEQMTGLSADDPAFA
jgi:hypothetical protein